MEREAPGAVQCEAPGAVGQWGGSAWGSGAVWGVRCLVPGAVSVGREAPAAVWGARRLRQSVCVTV